MKAILFLLVSIFSLSAFAHDPIQVPDFAGTARSAGDPPCTDCLVHGLLHNASAPVPITNFTEADRVALLQQIARGGINGQPTTNLTIGGRPMRVMNDGLKLPNGQYVNLRYAEARAIAQSWGCRLPTRAEAYEIRQYAERTGAAVRGRPQGQPSHSNQYRLMQSMMNDTNMHAYSERGDRELINGHFKWYIDNGDRPAFYGFRACSVYCQNSSGRAAPSFSIHASNPGYMDYSHSARFVCPR